MSATGRNPQRSAVTESGDAVADVAHGALARAVAELVDASMLTEVDLAEVRAVAEQVRGLTARLRERARTESLGASVTISGGVRTHGNTVVGLRNPLALVRPEDREVSDGVLRYRAEVGVAWEGPPAHVHGGVSALLLDQALGEACAVFGGPGMTGRLTLHYRRATPLGRLTVEAWLEQTDGTKTVARGRTLDSEGRTCVEAEGLFIFPKWAADQPQWQASRRR